MNMNAVEIKAFVPARDFELSKSFYQAAGFIMAFADDDIAYFRIGECAFLLQNDPGKALATPMMMHLLVENVDDWHARLTEQGIATRFGVTIGEPKDQPWAMRDFALRDPAGVQWLIAQNLPREPGN